MAYWDITSTNKWTYFSVDGLNITPEIKRESDGFGGTADKFRNVIKVVISRLIQNVTRMGVNEGDRVSAQPHFNAVPGGGQVPFVFTPPTGYGYWRIMGHRMDQTSEQGGKIYKETYDMVCKQEEWSTLDWAGTGG